MKAFIISVIDNCGLRIGNEKYKELYDTDGITTLKMLLERYLKKQKNLEVQLVENMVLV